VTTPTVQDQLIEDLNAKIGAIPNEDGLILFMGEILRSLLRRKGDAEFLSAIQDAYVTGLPDRTLEEQRQLARDIVRTVIETRPEIARAWETVHAPAPPRPSSEPARRATDHRTMADDGAEALEEDPSGAEAHDDTHAPVQDCAPAAPASSVSIEERLVRAVLRGLVEQRLQAFQHPTPPFPSLAYWHEQPFFLFSAAFARVNADFFGEDLLPQCVNALRSRLLDPLMDKLTRPAEEVEAFLLGQRPVLWRTLSERLGRLSILQRRAESKLASAGLSPVEIHRPGLSTARPRTRRVLDIAFTVTAALPPPASPAFPTAWAMLDAEEQGALLLLGRLRDRAAAAGLDLPIACDFAFLRTLHDFDPGRFAQTVRDFSALAPHGENGRHYLFERLGDLRRVMSDSLIDVLILTLFARFADQGFGIRDLVDLNAGAMPRGSSKTAVLHPFLAEELVRRPRDLAFQVREALRRRLEPAIVERAVDMLTGTWWALVRGQGPKALTPALTVLSAFPIAFAGDPDEQAMVEIGAVLHRTLTARVPDTERCALAVHNLYAEVLGKHAETTAAS
jgi:hypothetical protein